MTDTNTTPETDSDDSAATQAPETSTEANSEPENDSGAAAQATAPQQSTGTIETPTPDPVQPTGPVFQEPGDTSPTQPTTPTQPTQPSQPSQPSIFDANWAATNPVISFADAVTKLDTTKPNGNIVSILVQVGVKYDSGIISSIPVFVGNYTTGTNSNRVLDTVSHLTDDLVTRAIAQ
ncbi:MAG: hypothetical protein V4807_12155 [Burkholderia gladioli]|uniref:hypothetical protein n=1 Tax=Burkholderia gladioli TaxID=28095 RepID=UPI0028543D5A|nr:hypothetical protein [Burkholderia gladioli]MDR8091110.1 hypothetical protein [Burkholderia gladioli]